MLPDEPTTRLETYLARLAGQDVTIPDTPITRTECYLDYMIRNGGGVPASNAGAHNGIFRGESLGTSFTSAQSAAIIAGTFDGLFVGDFWTINSTVYRIAGFDLYTGAGETPPGHHAVIVPDANMDRAAMNDENTSATGYAETKMKTEVLPVVLETIVTDFGDAHILTRKSMLTASSSTAIWVDTRIDIMTESQVMGRGAWGASISRNVGDKITQFPLFALEPKFISSSTRASYWLQDVVNTTSFSVAGAYGNAGASGATGVNGVRPYFLIA